MVIRMSNQASSTVVAGDCLDVLPTIDAAIVDLVYLDPPFNTGKRRTASASSYGDSFDSTAAYVDFLKPRLVECSRVMKANASILLHCDWRASHHLRVLLDEIFGEAHFVNHLIWKYGLGGSSPRRFARKHDDILFYAKSSNYFFQPPRVPATSMRMKGKFKKATDVLDIPAINNMAAERCGYPTQKPLALLELLIGSCCPPKGLVLDPFCGSGTTLVAAKALGRDSIGIDRNPDAVDMATSRTVELISSQI